VKAETRVAPWRIAQIAESVFGLKDLCQLVNRLDPRALEIAVRAEPQVFSGGLGVIQVSAGS
jgi:hypothetical protein